MAHSSDDKARAKELYEQHGATDKARMLGAKEHGHHGTLSPAEQARATWAVQAQLRLLFDAWARRDSAVVRVYGRPSSTGPTRWKRPRAWASCRHR